MSVPPPPPPLFGEGFQQQQEHQHSPQQQPQPLVLVQTVQAAALKVLFECLKDVLHDLSMTFEASGIKVLAMDSSRTSLVHLRLDADKFDRYELRGGTVTAGVSAALFFRLLKVAGTDDVGTLLVRDTDVIGMFVANDAGRHTAYKVRALDVDTERFVVPDTVYDAVVKIPSGAFQRLVRDMLAVGSTIRIERMVDRVRLSCRGDFVEQETELMYTSTDDPGGCSSAATASPDVISGVFSLKHLGLFTKCSSLSQNTTLFMKKEFPLLVEFRVANLGTLSFLLAQID